LNGRTQRRSAFAPDHAVQRTGSAMKAVWWGAAGFAARKAASPGPAQRTPPPTRSQVPPEGFVREAWREAFEKDQRDVARGLYPPMDDGPVRPFKAVQAALDLIADARAVEARRGREGRTEARAETPVPGVYPAYYRQNFHFQSGGWFTEESARRYEVQVEALFGGTAGAMRRRALALLAQAWRGRDHRGLRIADVACGSGAFLRDLARTFPRARLTGIDLSLPYLEEARRGSGPASLIQANAERLPLASGSQDAVCCIYLFHELPPRIRVTVARELARVLKPGGLLAFADSLQPADEPRLARLLEVFPAYFHEPYFADFGTTDLAALFGGAGLVQRDQDRAFLTKAILFEKIAT
jgi:ubiquinone/menaquinone biosynthesis C-methylase UbiE